ncbi:MAG: sigma-70 family RNA polymerase sigma factor [Eubacteriales bacterium]|nr:sigma-70 family RNA polymerase sigma factor [Eubacteriales bacterium]
MDQFHDIYKRCAEKVYRFLLGLTQSADQAEELTAETFYQAFLHIDRFRGDCAIETWLCQIAKNAFYKEQKRRKRFYPGSEYLTERGEPDGALQRVEDRQTVLELHRHLHAMPEPYREVFELRVFGELQFQEIAAIFEKSESWAKMTYYRARARLARQMEVRDGTENS